MNDCCIIDIALCSRATTQKVKSSSKEADRAVYVETERVYLCDQTTVSWA